MTPISESMFEQCHFAGSKLVFCERFTENSDIWNLKWHNHSFMELIYFLDGGARVHGDSDDLILSVYDLVIYPEHFSHKEDVDLSSHQEIVCLGIELPGTSGLTHIRRLTDIDSRLRWLFIEIHTQATGQYKNKFALLDNMVRVLLHYLAQYVNATTDIRDPISRVIHFINENLSKRINVEDLANLANCSSSYLARRFKDRTGLTPIRYLDQVRLNASKRLLHRQDLDITQIASIVGFEDPKYYSRRFVNLFGMPPSQFRKQAEKNFNPKTF